MMEKLGWQPGTGLGKNKQGITAALSVRKTATHTAVITTLCTGYTPLDSINKDAAITNPRYRSDVLDKRARARSHSPSYRRKARDLGKISHIVTLKNETAEECGKYGKVKEVFVHKVS